MLQLQRHARIIDQLLYIGWIVVIVGFGLLFVSEVIVILLAGSLQQSDLMLWEWSSGWVSIQANEAMPPAEFRLFVGIALAETVILGSLIEYGIHLCRQVITPVRQGRPFPNNTAALIRRIAYVILVGSVAISTVEMTLSWFGASKLKHLLSLIESTTQVVITRTFDIGLSAICLTGVAFGLLVLLFSLVFQHGTELRKESDDTVIERDDNYHALMLG